MTIEEKAGDVLRQLSGAVITRTTALILRDDDKLSVAFTPLNIQLKEKALESSALVARVSDATENAAAVAAQATLREWLSQHEKAEEAIKKPLNTYKTNVIRICREDRKEVEDEYFRLTRLVGDFQTLEQAKVRAAESARRMEQETLERELEAERQRILQAEQAEHQRLAAEQREAATRLWEAKCEKDREEARVAQAEIERQKALAAAKSHEALEAVNEHFNRKAADLPIVQAARVEGQVVKNDWTIEVVDIYLLSHCHANCVKIEPRISEIKELLKLGVKVQGVRATPIVNSTVRAGAQKTIDV